MRATASSSSMRPTLSSTEGNVSSMEVKRRWLWILVASVGPVLWGAAYLVTRSALPADAPLWGAALRALPAGIVLLVLARRLPRGSWWWRSIVLGLLNFGAFFVLVYVAAQLLPSSVARSEEHKSELQTPMRIPYVVFCLTKNKTT